MSKFDLRSRARASGLHLAVSVLIALTAAMLVFGLWFPGIYRRVAGGFSLFTLITTVDIILGPLLTFAVFDIRKTRRHLAMDLSVIAAIQLAALVYGLYTVYNARPVAMVFETDRLRVVTVAQVEMSELGLAPPAYQQLPMTGPWLLGARAAAPGDESTDALFKGLSGIDRAQRPKFWRPYDELRADVLKRARPVSVLMARYPALREGLAADLSKLGLNDQDARFLPLVGREGEWVAIVDRDGKPVHYVPVDGFF